MPKLKHLMAMSLVMGWLLLVPTGARPFLAQDAKMDVKEAEQLVEQSVKLYRAGDYDEALALAERALSIFESALGPKHLSVGTALVITAQLHSIKGDYARAEPMNARALSILEKELGEQHADVATVLNNQGALYLNKGDYARAESMLQRAANIDEIALGREHPGYAIDLANLGKLYKAKGDISRAEQTYQRALGIFEKAHGPLHVDVATTLVNLANLHELVREYDKAEPLLQRALTIYEKALGAEHFYVAVCINNLAGVLEEKSDYARAVQLYQRSLAITESTMGAEHPEMASSLNNLGLVYQRTGDYARSESSYQRALVIWEKTLGAAHPDVAGLISNLSGLYEVKGDFARAVEFQARAGEIKERNLALVLVTGSENEKRLYLQTLAGETSATVSLHARSAPSNERAAQLALTTILRRKGRALDAMTDQIGALRRRANEMDRALLDDLVFARSELAKLQLANTGNLTPEKRQSEINLTEGEIEKLEDLISRRSADFRGASQPVTLDAVRAAIPPDAALVEIFSYQPTNTKAKNAAERFGANRYVAYIARRDASVPQWVELGDAAAIDEMVSRWRVMLGNPPLPKQGEKATPEELRGRMAEHEAQLKILARSLDERVMLPVRKLLGQTTRRIFLSPDGALNLIPFAALVDENNKYLVENYSITYLTSGRDLLRLQVRAEGGDAFVLMANPQFDAAPRPPAATGKNLRGMLVERLKPAEISFRQIDFASVQYAPLVGTAEEARSINVLLPGAKVLVDAQATEGALKQVARPRILHIATHGFFLPDQPQPEVKPATRGIGLETSLPATGANPSLLENPLLRSGLILAGVNQRASGAGDDGVLTALEASGLDLWGTKLVVLSACETGLGDVKNGEGVYGLRRALVLAGSETQVMSLWQVSDAATRDLMIAYYKLLQAGASRTEALRQVQLVMLRAGGFTETGEQQGLTPEATTRETDAKTLTLEGRHSHPFYWAAFIPSGAWTSLDGK